MLPFAEFQGPPDQAQAAPGRAAVVKEPSGAAGVVISLIWLLVGALALGAAIYLATLGFG